VLALVQSAVAGDSRVLREAEALVVAGCSVHLVGRGVPEGFVPPPGVTVDSVGRSAGLRPQPGGRPVGQGSPAVVRPFLGAARWLLLPEHRARVEAAWRAGAAAAVDAYLEQGAPDVVHAHDYNTLELAAAVAERTGAALVYDAHELWAGRARVGRPEPLRRRRAAAREDALMARADLVLTVSQGISERLRTRGAGRVVVVRNSFPAVVDEAALTPLPARPTGLVYAGRIGRGRDLETLAAAAPELAALGARPVVVGPADADYLARFAPHARGVDLRPAPLPLDEVDEVYRAAGLAVVTLDGSCENHRLALPNKLFHAVRAGVPVVAADLPELARVVTERGLGATYRPGDADSLASAVADVVGRYPQVRAAVADAALELSWERDAAVLVAAYAGLPARRPRPVAVAGSPAR
jgi:glycosyltransferase involved in cell wall biosynthesis